MICHSKKMKHELSEKELEILYEIVDEYGEEKKASLMGRIKTLIRMVRKRDKLNLKTTINGFITKLEEFI